jgi:hypothetical protein
MLRATEPPRSVRRPQRRVSSVEALAVVSESLTTGSRRASLGHVLGPCDSILATRSAPGASTGQLPRRAARTVATVMLLVLAGYPGFARAATSRAPSPARVARAIASQLLSAHTPQARARAVTAVAQLLPARILPPRGRPILNTGGYAAQAPTILQPEVSQLAGPSLSTRVMSDEQLAAALAAKGARVGAGAETRPIGAQDIRALVLTGVRFAATHSHVAGATPLLLLRELGRRQNPASDPLHLTPSQPLRLDAVQQWLLLYALAQATAQQGAPDVRAGTAAENICDRFNAWIANITAWGRWSSAFRAAIRKGGKIARLVRSAGIDVFHAFLIAGLVEVKADGPTSAGTHFGPRGEALHPGATLPPGQPIRFGLQVISHSGVRDSLILSCSSLVAFDIPPDGPVSGVSIDWANVPGQLPTAKGAPGLANPAFARLKQLGDIKADSETNADGKAELVFTPNEEVNGLGPIITEKGALRPSIALNSKFHILLGVPADLLGLRFETFRYAVERHADLHARVFINVRAHRVVHNGDDGLWLSTENTELHFMADITSLGAESNDAGVAATGTGPWTLDPSRPETYNTTGLDYSWDLISWTPGSIKITVTRTGPDSYVATVSDESYIMGHFNIVHVINPDRPVFVANLSDVSELPTNVTTFDRGSELVTAGGVIQPVPKFTATGDTSELPWQDGQEGSQQRDWRIELVADP